ncbi:MAG: transcription termination/antitermination protein NusG [Eubacteriales bacterium]
MSDFSDSIPEARWYVAHTYSGYENKVKANIEKIVENRGLQHLVMEVRVPLMPVDEADEAPVETEAAADADEETAAESPKVGSKGKGEPKPNEEKVFPSYVLVKMFMTDESWHVIRNIRGVTGFVGPGSKPVPLTDEEVEAIGIEVPDIKLDFEIGDSVKITSGPLTGYTGTVDSISDDKKTIRVLASMFGRETPVELASNEAEAIKY